VAPEQKRGRLGTALRLALYPRSADPGEVPQEELPVPGSSVHATHPKDFLVAALKVRECSVSSIAFPYCPIASALVRYLDHQSS
jgi:hypothetical protein